MADNFSSYERIIPPSAFEVVRHDILVFNDNVHPSTQKHSDAPGQWVIAGDDENPFRIVDVYLNIVIEQGPIRVIFNNAEFHII